MALEIFKFTSMEHVIAVFGPAQSALFSTIPRKLRRPRLVRYNVDFHTTFFVWKEGKAAMLYPIELLTPALCKLYAGLPQVIRYCGYYTHNPRLIGRP